MSGPSYRPQLHKHSRSAQNEAVGPSEAMALGVSRQTRAGTDPGQRPSINDRSHGLAVPRQLPTLRIPLIVPQKDCSTYSYNDNHESTRYTTSSQASSSRTTTERDRSAGSQLSVPTTPRHRRHDSALEIHDGTLSKETVVNMVSPTPSRSDLQRVDNSLEAASSSGDRSPEYGNRLSAMVAALDVQDLESSTTADITGSLDNADTDPIASVTDLLKRLQQWTVRTGDTSVLEVLVRDIFHLDTNRVQYPVRSRGVDPPELAPNECRVAGPSNRSTLRMSSTSNQYGEERSTGKQASSQVRQAMKTAHNSQVDRTRMRCPLSFDEDSEGCRASHSCIRDLV